MIDHGNSVYPNSGYGQFAPDPGVSLRNYFAWSLCDTVLQHAIDDNPGYPMTPDFCEAVAAVTYRLADALIAESKRETPCNPEESI